MGWIEITLAFLCGWLLRAALHYWQNAGRNE